MAWDQSTWETMALSLALMCVAAMLKLFPTPHKGEVWTLLNIACSIS